jgi:Nucleoside phosphorylase
MISILIIDDSASKVRDLKELLLRFHQIQESCIKCVQCTADAQNELSKNQYDLAIIDLYIPRYFGNQPNPENAIELLRLINEDEDIIKPYHLLGITVEKTINNAYKSIFDDNLWFLLRYDEMNDSWKSKLNIKIKYLINSKNSLLFNTEFNYDVAIITALQTPELSEILKLGTSWEETTITEDDCTTYYSNTMINGKGKKFKCIATSAYQMGSTASSLLASKVINYFRPRYLFMTGICAAIYDKGVNFGDILVATEVWDGASGKIKDINESSSLFQPDYRHLTLSPSFLNIINRLKKDKKLLNEIRDSFPTSNGLPSTVLKIHTGPMVSMPAVISSQSVVNELSKHSRKLLGIEMEAYGMFFAANNISQPRPEIIASLKSVSDYADQHKADDYQEYCSYTSARLLEYIILNELNY